jgi:type II secretory pathway component PulC
VGGPVAGVTQAITHAEGPEAGTTNRFGRQLGERRWVVRRPAVLEYYQELLDQPERMVAVFDSLKPVFDERHKVAGYLLGVEGEADFFSAAGLHEGDIVRRVNSMPMTSRRRAEFLINEFLQNRMSAVVLEIERDGRPAKLVYEVR